MVAQKILHLGKTFLIIIIFNIIHDKLELTTSVWPSSTNSDKILINLISFNSHTVPMKASFLEGGELFIQ